MAATKTKGAGRAWEGAPGDARNVLALFSRALRGALARLTAEDVTDLRRTPALAVAQLGWMPVATYDALHGVFSAHALRRVGFSNLSAATRDALERIAGRDALTNARTLFLIAVAIDQAFASRYDAFSEEHLASVGLSRPSPCFFGAASDTPPEIGRTTTTSVARPWFTTFAIEPVGATLAAFGGVPRPQRVSLSTAVDARLADAYEARSFTLALVTWRSHRPDDLRVRRQRPFALDGWAAHIESPGPMSALVEALGEAGAHVAVLPELALDDADEEALRAELRRRRPRLPALIVAGRMHRLRGATHVNEAIVLDARGNEIFAHEKIEPFTHPTLGTEDILPRRSDRYVYVDTGIGRVVVDICRDHASDPSVFLHRALDATLLVVPTYSKRLDFVAGEARALGQRNRAVTAAVNPLAPAGVQVLGYLYVPLRGTDQRPSDRSLSNGEHWVELTAPDGAVRVARWATIHPFRISYGEGASPLVEPQDVITL